MSGEVPTVGGSDPKVAGSPQSSNRPSCAFTGHRKLCRRFAFPFARNAIADEPNECLCLRHALALLRYAFPFIRIDRELTLTELALERHNQRANCAPGD